MSNYAIFIFRIDFVALLAKQMGFTFRLPMLSPDLVNQK